MRLKSLPRRGKQYVQHKLRFRRLRSVYERYRTFTMMPASHLASTLAVTEDNRHVPGCIIECGVWRGGMIAAMAEILGPSRDYFLFDSFEGIPAPKDIDGPAAKAWSEDKNGAWYYDNVKAEQSYSERAMQIAGATKAHFVKGWFDQTIPPFKAPEPIAILRLDGDWYDSIMVCLRHLVPQLAPDGIVLVDDYWTWDGCSRAIHDYLSETKSTRRIDRLYDNVCVVHNVAKPGTTTTSS